MSISRIVIMQPINVACAYRGPELIAVDGGFTLCDHLGTVRDVIAANGNVILHREYNAFGKVTRSTGKFGCIFRYTGKMFDDATALQWNINRWYDAEVGRWCSEDPIGFRGMDANLNRYVGNCVPIANDPLGLVVSLTVGVHGPLRSDVRLKCPCGTGPSTLEESIQAQINAEGTVSVAPLGLGLTGTIGFTVLRGWTFTMVCDMSHKPHGNGYVRKIASFDGSIQATINYNFWGNFVSVTNIRITGDLYEAVEDRSHCCFATKEEWEKKKCDCECEAKSW